MDRPWWKFCGRDWLNDLELRKCSLAARGLWIDMLALMNEGHPYGYMATKSGPVSAAELSHIARIPHIKCTSLLRELESNKVFSRGIDGGVIFSRRMVRDEELRIIKQSSGKRGGNPKLLKQDVNVQDNSVHKQRSESDSESFSGSSFSESEVKEKNLVKSIDGEGFQEYIGVFLSLGVAISETDMRKCSMYWISLSFEEQLAALTDVRKQHAGQWSSCATRYVTRPWNHLEEKHWTRRAMVPAKDRGKTQAEAEQAKATRMFMDGKGL